MLILQISGLITIRICIDPLENIIFALSIRGTDSLYSSGSQPFIPPGRTMVQVQVSRAAHMSFTYYVINTNQPDL